jgi:hypothetical protein
VQPSPPLASVPFVVGVLRRLEVAPGLDGLMPPPPAPGLSCGRGVEALGRALLAGPQALSKGGRRLEERGRVALVQPGRTRASLHEARCGPLLDALLAAHLHTVVRASALTALEG